MSSDYKRILESDSWTTEPNSGCHIWLGPDNGEGYGRWIKCKPYKYVHRVAYEAVKGPIPEGHEIHHRCRVRSCFNPEHLVAITRGEHLRATYKENGLKTHCIRGHVFDEKNTYHYTDPQGNNRRVCRACDALRSPEKYRRKHARQHSKDVA